MPIYMAIIQSLWLDKSLYGSVKMADPLKNNVTPLLDLAFVLLIIFMITTPLLDQGMNLDLPRGGVPDPTFDPEQIRVIEVDAEGAVFLDQEPMGLGALTTAIGQAFQE